MHQNAELQAQLQRATAATRMFDLLTESADLDSATVQARLLRLIAPTTGYERAIIARYDAQRAVLTGWSCSCHPDGEAACIAADQRLALDPPLGGIAQAVAANRPALLTAAQLTADDPPPVMRDWQQGAVLPLALRDGVLGVLLVDNPTSQRPLTEDDLSWLTSLARDMSLVLLGIRREIDHAHHWLSETERSRDVTALHETLIQPLHGLAYALEASSRALPEQDVALKAQMSYLQAQVQQAKGTIRHALFDFWPEQLDSARFAAELEAYAREASTPRIEITIDPHYDALPLDPRQQLFRIAREVLGYVIARAAERLSIRLSWSPTQIQLVVLAQGPVGAAREEAPITPGIIARVAALGGRFELTRQPDQLLVQVTLPAAW